MFPNALTLKGEKERRGSLSANQRRRRAKLQLSRRHRPRTHGGWKSVLSRVRGGRKGRGREPRCALFATLQNVSPACSRPTPMQEKCWLLPHPAASRTERRKQTPPSLPGRAGKNFKAPPITQVLALTGISVLSSQSRWEMRRKQGEQTSR